MKVLRTILIIAAGLMMGVNLIAQQVPMYSQYVMNGFLINPSFAGSDGYTSLNLTAREQWVGIQNAPSTYAVSFQTRLLKNSYIQKTTTVRKKLVKPTRGGRVGLGGYIFNDQNGIISRTGFEIAYAYHIAMQNSNQLSFGLAATGYQFAVDLDGAVITDLDDEFLNNYDRVVFIPDFNFGVSFTNRNFYLGFAATQLFRGSLMVGNSANNPNTELGHFFLSGGLKIPLTGNEEWIIEPSVLMKSSDMFLKAFQADLTARVYYKDNYWAGISYRTQDALVFLVGFSYDRYYFAYAFDFLLSDIRQYSYGSHELSFAVKFGDNARRYRWLNRY